MLHGLESTAPLVLDWFFDVAENNAAAALNLKFHEAFCMFLLFVSSFLKELGKARESHIVPVKVVRLVCVCVCGGAGGL